MSRRYQRNERDWPRQEQNWPEQNEWSGGRRERQDERNWREQEYESRGSQEMGGRGPRRQRQQGMPDPWNRERENEMWQGPGRQQWERERNYGMEQRGEWEGNERGWDRGPEGWQRDRGQGEPRDYDNRIGNISERYAGLGGRGWTQGWNDAMHREREGQHAGRGPRNYKRSDNRIEEDINDRLTQHPMIDASDLEVSVQNCEVTLRGTAENREAKRLAEDIAESVFGVKEVNNQIKLKQRGETEGMRHETETPGKQRKAG